MSRSLLSERLRRLERAGVLERRITSRGRPSEYRLTAAGRELQRIIDIIGEWGARWAFDDPRLSELDPIVLLWWMRRRVSVENILPRCIVIEFHFRERPKQNYWLLIKPGDVSICLKHPGFDIDLIVTSDLQTFYRVWLGRAGLSDALRNKQIHLDGTPADVRAFQRWFTLSPMANAVRGAVAVREKNGRRTNGREVA